MDQTVASVEYITSLFQTLSLRTDTCSPPCVSTLEAMLNFTVTFSPGVVQTVSSGNVLVRLL